MQSFAKCLTFKVLKAHFQSLMQWCAIGAVTERGFLDAVMMCTLHTQVDFKLLKALCGLYKLY